MPGLQRDMESTAVIQKIPLK
jgi:hypothetical protein